MQKDIERKNSVNVWYFACPTEKNAKGLEDLHLTSEGLLRGHADVPSLSVRCVRSHTQVHLDCTRRGARQAFGVHVDLLSFSAHPRRSRPQPTAACWGSRVESYSAVLPCDHDWREDWKPTQTPSPCCPSAHGPGFRWWWDPARHGLDVVVSVPKTAGRRLNAPQGPCDEGDPGALPPQQMLGGCFRRGHE